MNWLTSILPQSPASAVRGQAAKDASHRVGLMRPVMEQLATMEHLKAAFPGVEFVDAGMEWPDAAQALTYDLFVAAVSASEIPSLIGAIRARPRGMELIVVLSGANIETTRLLLRSGVADVLGHPMDENALAVSIDRVLMRETTQEPSRPKEPGRVVAVVKAGGGVGATSLCLLAATHLAGSRQGDIAVADLDLQFGAMSAQLGLSGAFTIADLLGAGGALGETPFSRALHTTPAGLRVLASAGETLPVDSIAPSQADQLVRGLKRDFGLTLIDLPSTWTTWTYRILQQADHVVMVTQMSIPRIDLVRRGLAMLVAQGIPKKAVTLVCNAVSPDQSDRLPLKWAEKPLGRGFDFIIPEDRRAMDAFVNEGVVPAQRGPSAKFHSAVQRLADALGANTVSRAVGNR